MKEGSGWGVLCVETERGLKQGVNVVALLSNYKDLMAQTGSCLVKKKSFALINKDLISLSATDAWMAA